MASNDEASSDFPVATRYGPIISRVSMTCKVGLLMNDAVRSACMAAATGKNSSVLLIA